VSTTRTGRDEDESLVFGWERVDGVREGFWGGRNVRVRLISPWTDSPALLTRIGHGSGSPYERTFQHKNTIIVLYNLSEETPYRHIDYYFPKSLSKKEQDDSGWIFAIGGAAYIAVRPFKPGTWSDEEHCERLRSPHLKNGLITVVGDSTNYTGWQDFKNKIKQTSVDLSQLDSKVEVAYTTTSGDKMTFRFPDQRMLNNEKIDLSRTPLFAGPYLNGNEQVLRMNHGGEELVIDFKNDAIIKRLQD